MSAAAALRESMFLLSLVLLFSNLPRMRAFLVFWTFLLVWGAAWGQDRHFVYLQADNEQPFYVTLGAQTRSSTASGYMILSKLRDSSIEFVVGFPMRKYPEYRFRVNRLARDRGMALKDFGSKGWGLFDFQTFEVTMGESLSQPLAEQSPKPVRAVRDSFATVLASVIGDSTVMDPSLIIRTNDVVGQLPALPDTAADAAATSIAAIVSISVRDTLMRAQASPLMDTAFEALPLVASTASDTSAVPSAFVATLPTPDSVMRAQSSPVADSTLSASFPSIQTAAVDSARQPADISFTSSTSDSLYGSATRMAADSVMSSIPTLISPGSVSRDSAQVTGAVSAESQTDMERMLAGSLESRDTAAQVLLPTAPLQSEAPTTSISALTRRLLAFSDSTGYQLVFADPDLSGHVDTISVWVPSLTLRLPAENAISVSSQSGALMPSVRMDCAGMVSAMELGQLRRRMESIPNEDAKVAAALREFRYRCFTTEQVRSLLVVFFREEGRLKLLDAAYSRVFDPASFPSLQSVFKDPNMMKRFRRLIGQ